MNEWEVLTYIHKKLGLIPNLREFEKNLRRLAKAGYIEAERGRGIERLHVTREGSLLLRRLESEHRAILSSLSVPSTTGNR